MLAALEEGAAASLTERPCRDPASKSGLTVFDCNISPQSNAIAGHDGASSRLFTSGYY